MLARGRRGAVVNRTFSISEGVQIKKVKISTVDWFIINAERGRKLINKQVGSSIGGLKLGKKAGDGPKWCVVPRTRLLGRQAWGRAQVRGQGDQVRVGALGGHGA
jgi:hypothetical protein